jgi:hypothetical protein
MSPKKSEKWIILYGIAPYGIATSSFVQNISSSCMDGYI